MALIPSPSPDHFPRRSRRVGGPRNSMSLMTLCSKPYRCHGKWSGEGLGMRATPGRQPQPTQKPPKSAQQPPSLAASVSQALQALSGVTGVIRVNSLFSWPVLRTSQPSPQQAERMNLLTALANALSALERVSNAKALFFWRALQQPHVTGIAASKAPALPPGRERGQR